MFNLSSHTLRENLNPVLMIRSIFLWLMAETSLPCQARDIHTPAVAWQGSRKTFSHHCPFNNHIRCPSSLRSWNHNLLIHTVQHIWRSFTQGCRDVPTTSIVPRPFPCSLLPFFLSDSTLAAAYRAASLGIPHLS